MDSITPALSPRQKAMWGDLALVFTKAVRRPPNPVARPAMVDMTRGRRYVNCGSVSDKLTVALKLASFVDIDKGCAFSIGGALLYVYYITTQD